MLDHSTVRRISAILGFAALAIIGVGWPTRSACAAEADATTAERARLLLAAGRPQQAAVLFQATWQESTTAEWPKARTAFYLALCAEATHKPAEVEHWRQVAVSEASPEFDRMTLDLCSAARFLPDESLQLGLLSRLLPTLVLSERASRLPELAGHVRRARDAVGRDASLVNRVEAATWLLMFAEVAAEEPSAGLWTRSLDAFHEGGQRLAEVQAMLDRQPELDKVLSRNPAVAMKFDAAVVRKQRIEQREQLARREERKRVDQLRRMTLAYRDAAQGLAGGCYALASDDHPGCRQATATAIGCLKTVFDIAKERSDQHLLQEEPSLDGTNDFLLTQFSATLFANDAISSLAAIHALIGCKADPSQSMAERMERLNEAESWARAALGQKTLSLLSIAPENNKNPLAHYSLARVAEARAVLTLSNDIGNAARRTQASADLQLAKQQYAMAREAVDPKQRPSALQTTILEHHAAVTDARSAGKEAERAMLEGRTGDCWRILGEAARRHLDPEVWLAWLDAGRRCREASPNEVVALGRDAVALGVLQADDPRLGLIESQLVLNDVWNQWCQKPEDANLRTGLIHRLAENRKRLDRCAGSKVSDAIRAQIAAAQALNTAYESMLGAQLDSVSLTDAFARAKKTHEDIQQLLNNTPTTTNQLLLRESLIASRLAIGHLGSRVLPKYRDEPVLAFMAAYDEMARLPFGPTEIKAMASPLLKALTERSDASDHHLALEERQHRQMMSRFVEAVITLQLGEPRAALEQMDAAVNRLVAPMKDNSDASSSLAQADGLGLQEMLLTDAASVQALTQMQLGHTNEALSTAARAVASSATPGDIETALARCESPLATYALAAASVAAVEASERQSSSEQSSLIAQAIAAQQRTTALIAAPRAQSRFPHIASLNERLGKELASPEYLAERCDSSRRRGDLTAAAEYVRRGLAIHPQSKVLWDRYFEIEAMAAGRDNSEVAWTRILARIDEAVRAGMIRDSTADIHRGHAYERLNRKPEALQAYLRAAATADTPADRIHASARAAALRVAVAMR